MNLTATAAATKVLIAGLASLTVVHAFNPLVVDERSIQSAPVGASLRELAPRTSIPFVCILNGAPVLRADWDWCPQPGDHVLFMPAVAPLGGGGGGSNPLRMILQIALVVFAAWVVGPYAGVLGTTGTALAQAAIVFVGTALLNAALPPPSGAAAGSAFMASPSPTYNVAFQGNSVRLEQPIPVCYGQNKTYPDFACQPYALYIDGEQFYHAALCIGQGQYRVLQVCIEDTDIRNFDDVETLVCGPGQPSSIAAQTLVKTNIVTSPEVAGQDLIPGQYVGPFTVSNAEDLVNSIGIDITMPRGLYLADEAGNLGYISIEWRVEARLIDEYGRPTGAWVLLATETHTANTSTPPRLSYEYSVPVGRYQVRVVRSDFRNNNIRAGHDLSWIGLRGTLDRQGIVNTTATFLVVRVRASEQLSGLSQRKFSVLHRRMLPVWNGSAWSAPIETRNGAWAIADIWKNTVYGRKLPDSRINIAGLLTLAQLWDARQDRFDYSFDSTTTVDDAAALVARVGRAVPVQRGGVWSVVRDSEQTVPVAMFSQRNMNQGSFGLEYLMPTEDTADAVKLEYFDGVVWDWRTVTAQFHNGVIYHYRTDQERVAQGLPVPVRSVRVRFPGIVGRTHALREARYMVAANVYRRTIIGFTTELDGMIPSYGSLIAVGHDMPAWGQSGDIVAFNEGTLVATLSEPVEFSTGTHYIRIQRPNGSLSNAIAVTVGGADNEVVLASAPGFALVTNSANRERPRYLFGATDDVGVLARTIGIRPEAEGDVGYVAVLEDGRVHTTDNALLPIGGAVQDPLSDGENMVDAGAGGGPVTLVLVQLRDHEVIDNIYGIETPYPAVATFVLRNNGVARTITSQFLQYTNSDYADEWLRFNPNSAGASGFEVRATLAGGQAVFLEPNFVDGQNTTVVTDIAPWVTGSLGEWLPLSSDRNWAVNCPPPPQYVSGYIHTAALLLEIREISTGIVVDTA